MDTSLRTRAEELASEIASQAETAEDLNNVMRLMMKAAMERMLNTEMDVHLGRKSTADQQAGQTATAAESSPATETTGKRAPNRRNGLRAAKVIDGERIEINDGLQLQRLL